MSLRPLEMLGGLHKFGLRCRLSMDRSLSVDDSEQTVATLKTLALREPCRRSLTKFLQAGDRVMTYPLWRIGRLPPAYADFESRSRRRQFEMRSGWRRAMGDTTTSATGRARNRRSFLKKGAFAAGAAALGVGLSQSSVPVLAKQGP